MTFKEAIAAIDTLEAQWAADSNSTTDQERLFELCEAYIAANRAVLTAVGAHPDPPPPRVRA